MTVLLFQIFLKLNDVLFVYNWLFVVISNDKTIVRNLQRYFMIKMIHTDRALGPLNTVNPGYLEH